MLRRDQGAKQPAFADQARAAQAVPEEHVLMRMKRAVDWSAVEAALAVYYTSAEGRPSWPPAVPARMLLIEQYAGLSDREAHEQAGYNLLYRAFAGLGVDEAVPDDTTLVKFRVRIGEAGAREVFALLNGQWEGAGLISEKRRVLDGVRLWAKVARRSWISLMREGRTLVVEAVAAADAGLAETLRAEFAPPAGEAEPRGEEALKLERERTAKLLAAVADIKDERVRDRARIVEAMLGEYKSHEAIDPDKLKARCRIEAKFDEQMNRHGLRHARYWGLAKVTAQVLWNVVTVNLKRAAKLLREQAAGPPATAAAPA